MFGFFNKIIDVAEGAGDKADKLKSQSIVAKQRLKELDDRLAKGLISESAYDKLANLERASLAYLSKPIKKDPKIQYYSGLMDKMFLILIGGVIGSTLLLMHVYREPDEPSKPLR